MKYLIIPLCLISSLALAQEVCPKGGNPLTDIKNLCADLNQKNQAHCDVKTPVQKETIGPVTYGLLMASSRMKSLFADLETAQVNFLKDSVGCPGGCSKNSAPIVEIKTRPTGTVPHASCPADYQPMSLGPEDLSKHGVSLANSAFKKNFKGRGSLKTCQEQASKFAQGVLMADSDFGKTLESKNCLSPCTYSSTIRMKTVPTDDGQCSVDLELTVLCGPPKKDREWMTEASLTKAFKCEVQK